VIFFDKSPLRPAVATSAMFADLAGQVCSPSS